MRLNRLWMLLAFAAVPAALAAGNQALRRMYTPPYPDVALHAGLALTGRPRRVLALAAHPGDLERAAAGTLFLMARAGSEITAGVLTGGERGGARLNLAEIRRREQEQAAAILGYADLVQLQLPDQGLAGHPRLAPAVRELWERVQPKVVFAPDPGGPGVVGGTPADHVALGNAAILAARAHLASGVSLYLYRTRRPNVLVDIAEVLPEKQSAVKAHRSVLRGPDQLSDTAVKVASGLSRGGTPSKYAESFYRLV